jgi:hypothetical protein
MKLSFLLPVLLLLLVSVSVPAVAADFAATIDSDHVKSGESVTLNLTLSGAIPQGAPDIGALKQSFTIASQVQSSDIVIGPGTTNTAVHWQLTLIPKSEGRLSIPSVMIKTVAGTLHTTPLTLVVDQGSAPILSEARLDGSVVSISAMASTTKPYQNQSIRYTVRCAVRGNISEVSLSDITINNAIIEQEGKPDVHDEIENGSAVRIVEIHYIVTPLQPGTVIIPSVVLQGKIGTPDVSSVADPFGGGLSSGMQQVMKFLSSFGGEPFSVASNKTQLDVKPPAVTMDPWLPLTSLKLIEDSHISQSVRAGEPLVRKITLLADGAVGSQLPDLEAKQGQKNLRVYADKATTGQDVDKKSGTILGWRKESYTLIPQKAGRLVLPAIKVQWWDIANSKIAIAELPEQLVNVLAVAAPRNSPPAGATATIRFSPVQSSKRYRAPSNVISLLTYGLAAVLAGVMFFAAFWGLRLRRKIGHQRTKDKRVLAGPKPQSGILAPRPVTKWDLDKVRTVEELKNFLRAYLHERHGLSRNASLEKSFTALSNSWAEREKGDVEAVINGIGTALYAGGVVEVEDLKKSSRRILAALNRKSNNRRKDQEKLRCLNPS